MLIEEECECPFCVHMAKYPRPRNRSERREHMKEVKIAMKKLYYFHMTNMVMNEIIEKEYELEDNEDGCGAISI